MPEINDGYIYGLDKVYFKQKEIGYISEEGLTPGGDQPSSTKIRAAQLKNAVVKVLLTTPGSVTFGFNLIQLLAQKVADIFGGTASANGDYSAPKNNPTLEGPLLIECASGHKIIAPKASLTANLGGAINLAGVMQLACTAEVVSPDDGQASPFEILAPGSDRDLSDYLPEEG
jgi:hypothetical protein